MPSGTRPDKEVADARRGGGFTGRGAAFGGGRGLGGNQYDSRLNNARYAQSPGVARPATLGNLGTALGMGVGFGPGTAASLIGGAAMGIDPYSGPMSPSTNFSYDPKNFTPLNSRRMGNFSPVQLRSLSRAKPAPQPVQPVSNLQQNFVPAATLGGPIPGLANYGVDLPSYSYFGLPGQKRPQSLIMGGI